jgi:hypothetical protein
MATTKAVHSTIPEIELKLKGYTGDMVRIEYLENCLKQILPNDVKRFCHLKLADLYAYKLMHGTAAKHMDLAADCATTYRDKIDFYLKEISLLIKAGDYLFIDKAYKKAQTVGNPNEKMEVRNYLKNQLMTHAQDLEKRNKRSNASQVYERIIEIHGLVSEAERKDIIKKLAELNSRLGRVRNAMTYETMLTKPIPQKKLDPEGDVRRVSYDDLGIEFY